MITAGRIDWTTTRDASKFRKLYGRLPQDINGSGHDEAELNTNGQSDQDEDNEEDDIEQYDEENEQANDNVATNGKTGTRKTATSLAKRL